MTNNRQIVGVVLGSYRMPSTCHKFLGNFQQRKVPGICKKTNVVVAQKQVTKIGKITFPSTLLASVTFSLIFPRYSFTLNFGANGIGSFIPKISINPSLSKKEKYP